MAEALEEVCVVKRQRYEEWRAAHLSTPFLSRWRRRILRFLLLSAAPAAAVAFGAVHDFDRTRMGDALRNSGSRLRERLRLPAKQQQHGSGNSSASQVPAAIEAAAPPPAAAGDHHHAPPAAAHPVVAAPPAAAHPVAAAGGGSRRKGGESAASSALREAEEALKAAEAAQKAALDELQRSTRPPPKKHGWFN
jgi:hypothetical protein